MYNTIVYSNPLLGIYPQGLKARTWIDTCILIGTVALFIRAKRKKHLQWPHSNSWINKWNTVSNYKMDYSAPNRKDILTHSTIWMTLKTFRQVQWASDKVSDFHQESHSCQIYTGHLKVAGQWAGRASDDSLCNGPEVSVWKDKKFCRWSITHALKNGLKKKPIHFMLYALSYRKTGNA